MPRTKIPEPTLGDDHIWGMENIAAEIGLPKKQAYYLAREKDDTSKTKYPKLPVIHVGHRTVVASREQLRQWLASCDELAGESPKQSGR